MKEIKSSEVLWSQKEFCYNQRKCLICTACSFACKECIDFLNTIYEQPGRYISKIEDGKVNVTRRLVDNWSVEHHEDLVTEFNSELIDDLAQKIADEIDEEIMRSLCKD